MTIEKPWGRYTVLNEGKGFKVKLIEVFPRKKLSLQKHKFRSEHWVVVEGTAGIAHLKKEFLLNPGQSEYIPKGETHRLENVTDKLLKIVEVQCGEYLAEDDIERLDDDYGRK